MLDSPVDLFIVTDLKQYTYCPRIVYYERCLPDFRPRTYKMDAGKQEHQRESKRAARRGLAKYGLEEGERLFDVLLRSERLGVVGRLDEIIVTSEAAYPVDYKLSRNISRHHRLQLAAYGLLIEDQWGLPAPHGYLYLIAQRRAEKVAFTSSLRSELSAALVEIARITYQEYFPPPPNSCRPCRNCEFRRACNHC